MIVVSAALPPPPSPASPPIGLQGVYRCNFMLYITEFGFQLDMATEVACSWPLVSEDMLRFNMYVCVFPSCGLCMYIK